MTAAQRLLTVNGERIAFVAGLRTPFAKQATDFHGVPAVDLGKMVYEALIADPRRSILAVPWNDDLRHACGCVCEDLGV